MAGLPLFAAAAFLIPGIIPMPVPYYEYAPVDGRPARYLYSDPRFLAALAECQVPTPGYGFFHAPSDRSVKCMDSRGYILVEDFRPPRN